MKNILIIGANSAIAKAFCRLYLQRHGGNEPITFNLVARNAAKLETLKNDLVARGASEVFTRSADLSLATSATETATYLAELPAPIDLALLAYGNLPVQKECEDDAAPMLEALFLNFTGAAMLLHVVAKKMEIQGQGKIGVISSVAGDRGRQSNYVYGAAKAGLDTFTAGLRNRFGHSPVQVLTIRPGFVDTPMTQDFEKKGFLWASPEKVAGDILRAFEKEKHILYTPWFWRWIMLVIRTIPERLFVKLKL